MTAAHENCLPLHWLLALPARVRAAIIHCELTLDDTLPPPTSDWHPAARRFIPPSGAESPDGRPSSTRARRAAVERLERLTAACRVPEETILQYIRAHWDSDCASLPSAPRGVLEEIVRAWPDVLADITAAKRHRPPSRDGMEIPARPPEDPLPNTNHANADATRNSTSAAPVSVATL